MSNYIFDLEPNRLCPSYSRRDNGWHPVPLALNLKPYSQYLSLFSDFRILFSLSSVFRLPHSAFCFLCPLFSDFRIPHSAFRLLCPLSVSCIRQVEEHLLEGGIGYIGLSLEFGGGSAGDQMPFVDNTDTLTDILGHCQCMR